MTASQNQPGRVPGTAHDLADVLSHTARRLQQEHGDLEATLQAVTTTAVAVVPHVDECSISYVSGRSRVVPRAATGELPRSVDALQEEVGQGPCLDAIREQEVVRVGDMASEGRWPEFARRAAALGVGSMLCFRLFVEGDRLGALNLYSRRPRAFDEESLEIGQLLAAHAAVAVAGAEYEHDLLAAVRSRDLIGQAKGILMERYKLTADQSFGVLARVSQELNRKLVDVADELAGTGALPGGGRRD